MVMSDDHKNAHDSKNKFIIENDHKHKCTLQINLWS